MPTAPESTWVQERSPCPCSCHTEVEMCAVGAGGPYWGGRCPDLTRSVWDPWQSSDAVQPSLYSSYLS